MSVYEYACLSCQHRFERTEPISDHDKDTRPVCPACGGRRTRQLMSRFHAKTRRKS